MRAQHCRKATLGKRATPTLLGLGFGFGLGLGFGLGFGVRACRVG